MCEVHARPIKEKEKNLRSTAVPMTISDSWLSLEVQVWNVALDLTWPIQSITKDQITNKERLYDSLVTSTLPEGWLPCSPDMERGA